MSASESIETKERAKLLCVTPETIDSHIRHIYSKLQVESRVQATVTAKARSDAPLDLAHATVTPAMRQCAPRPRPTPACSTRQLGRSCGSRNPLTPAGSTQAPPANLSG
ncbi:LuxR C-terminal-related transcriptional regulator [Pseudomonas knackmussii]|uniref:LuxR C-terminal-related transcriptional regulator n=1 Tax=Pseudomonas knackmussii TaxID=65741 RepID=UPI0038B4EA00